MPRPRSELPPPSVIRGMRAAGMTWKEIIRDLARSGYDDVCDRTLRRVLSEDGVVLSDLRAPESSWHLLSSARP